jgi:hypothetical protein
MKVVVALSSLFSVVVMVLLVQAAPAFLAGLGGWSTLAQVVMGFWTALLLLFGNMGLWWFGTGFKKSFKK